MTDASAAHKRDRPPAGRRGQVWRLLRDAHRPMDVTEIAARLGVHANTVRFHLETLVDNGQVEHTTLGRGTPGRPARLYRPAPGMDPSGPRNYLGLAEALVQHLAGAPDPRDRAIEAGRSWGHLQASTATDATGRDDPVALLIRMLDELGFAPERPSDTDRRSIGLRHCPFLELATARPEVVCPLHLGLMQGAMEVWDSSVTVDRLDTLIEPGLCSARLTATETS